MGIGLGYPWVHGLVRKLYANYDHQYCDPSSYLYLNKFNRGNTISSSYLHHGWRDDKQPGITRGDNDTMYAGAWVFCADGVGTVSASVLLATEEWRG